MTEFSLSPRQMAVIQAPLDRKAFISGPAGSGKTTAGAARLRFWLDAGVPADRVLVLAPQRTLLEPYDAVRRDPALAPGGEATLVTVGGLARRMVDLFWPLVAEEAGFAHPEERPIFLTLETAQYFMARTVAPLLDQGYFESLTIDRNRLYSQIIDNLNKAAVVGFSHTEIAARLKAAWTGEKSQLRIYDEAQECAARFRRTCLEHNLLDFSLQLEMFVRYLWPEPLCRDHLLERGAYLIVENVEEDTPVAHDLLRDWLPRTASALVIYDEEAGHRSFLGADPAGALLLADLCDEHVTFTDSLVMSPPVAALGRELACALGKEVSPKSLGEKRPSLSALPLHYEVHRYHPEMLDWVAEAIAGLVHNEGVSPAEIVVLAPFLTDVLRFSLAHRLERLDVPARSHRPSRALRDEPAAQCLLTLTALAHPAWRLAPSGYDVAYALVQAIAGLDLVRAQLLAKILYRVKDGAPVLLAFDGLKTEVQQRITYLLGGRYEALRMWLQGYAGAPILELDHFLSHLFGELLSQPGFGFDHDYDAARVAANLIESVRKFRQIAAGPEGTRAGKNFTTENTENTERNKKLWALPAHTYGLCPPCRYLGSGLSRLGQEYVEMVQAGVVAAQYVRNWQAGPDEAVLLAPAYTFLMRNRPVDYQFWLNVGGRGWWERLYQPLTHPYVLSRRWPAGTLWMDSDEMAFREASLYRLTQGLVHRCRKGVFLGLSELGEQGYEQTGPLLKAVQRVLRGSGAESPRQVVKS